MKRRGKQVHAGAENFGRLPGTDYVPDDDVRVQYPDSTVAVALALRMFNIPASVIAQMLAVPHPAVRYWTDQGGRAGVEPDHALHDAILNLIERHK